MYQRRLALIVPMILAACGGTALEPVDGAAGSSGSESGGSGGDAGAAGATGGTGGAAGTGGSAGTSGTGGSAQTGGAGGGTTTNDCEPVEEGVTVVACDFPPEVIPVAVDEVAVYAITSGTRIIRVEKATGAKSELYRNDFSNSGDRFRYANAATADDGFLYFGADISVGGGVSFGIRKVPKTGGSATIVMEFGTDGFGESLFQDDEHLYFLGNDGGFNSYDSLRRVPKTGKFSQSVGAAYGKIVDVRGGFIYFVNDGALSRMPASGGDTEVIVPSLPVFASPGDTHQVAVDDTHAYYGEEGEFLGTHAIYRVPIEGGSPELVVSYDDVESGYGPHHLRVEDGIAYYMRYSNVMLAVSAEGGDPQSVVNGGDSLSPPIFDDTRLYVAYTRGGIESPIEGVIVSRLKL